MGTGVEIREESNGRWTIFDRFTTMPIEIRGSLQTDLSSADANEVVAMLNALDLKRRLENLD